MGRKETTLEYEKSERLKKVGKNWEEKWSEPKLRKERKIGRRDGERELGD